MPITSITVTFSYACSFADEYDMVAVYDLNDNEIAVFWGNVSSSGAVGDQQNIAGASVVVPGDGFKIWWYTDGTGSGNYGWAIQSVVANTGEWGSAPYPQSAHPYADDVDQWYTYRITDTPYAYVNGLMAQWKCNEVSAGSSAVTRLETFGGPSGLDAGTSFMPSNSAGINGSNCLALDAGRRIDIENNPRFNFDGNQSFGLVIWHKAVSLGNSGQLFCKHDVSNQQCRLDYSNASQRYRFAVSATGTADVIVSWGSAPTLNIWNMIAGWYDSVLKKIYISVNAAAAVELAHAAGIRRGTSLWRIGARRSTEYSGPGYVDNAQIFGRTLTQADLTYMWNAGAGREEGAAAPSTDRMPFNLRRQVSSRPRSRGRFSPISLRRKSPFDSPVATVYKDLSGSTTLDFDQAGSLSRIKELSGSTSLTIDSLGSLSFIGAVKDLSGTTNLTFDSFADLVSEEFLTTEVDLSGSVDLLFTGSGQLTNRLSITGSSTLTLNASGSLYKPSGTANPWLRFAVVQSQFVSAPIRFSILPAALAYVRFGISTNVPSEVVNPIAAYLGGGVLLASWTEPVQGAIDYYEIQIALNSTGPYGGYGANRFSMKQGLISNLPSAIGKIYARIRAISTTAVAGPWAQVKKGKLTKPIIQMKCSAPAGSVIPAGARFAIETEPGYMLGFQAVEEINFTA